MFTSGFKHWLEINDPYGLQQITLPKAIFVATIATYVYWIYQPAALLNFYVVFFVAGFYESPALETFEQKVRLLIFITIALILTSVSFYLVYPFTGTFFFFSVFALAVTYFAVMKYFYALKNLTMLLIVNGTIVLATEPQGSLQVAYNFASAILIAMTTLFISLKIYPNHYLVVWNKAMQKFIFCLEGDIDYAIRQERKSSAEEITHLGMARNYRRLIPKKYLNSAYRFAINLRNIEHSLESLYYETKNIEFWQGVQKQLQLIRQNMEDYIPCDGPDSSIKPETPLQHYIIRCLNQVFIHWNALCSLQYK